MKHLPSNKGGAHTLETNLINDHSVETRDEAAFGDVLVGQKHSARVEDDVGDNADGNQK